MPERAGWVRLNAGDAGWVQRRSAFVHFELRGLSPGSSTKAAEFLGSETLRYPLLAGASRSAPPIQERPRYDAVNKSPSIELSLIFLSFSVAGPAGL